jgi:hypothetical protein
MLRIVAYGALPIAENGTLLSLRFVSVGRVGEISPLTCARIMFNEGEIGETTFNGQVELVEHRQ